MIAHSAKFRFYEELNDFLPPEKKKREFSLQFKGRPSIKDAIEDIGIPHTEIDLIIVNGNSVGFDYHLKNEDHISVYPVFEGIDISPIIKLRAKPLRNTTFVLDVHLGKLSRLLRMLGFDTLYKNDFNDRDIIKISLDNNRIILTRDIGILKHRSVTHGYFIRFSNPIDQIIEIIHRFDLKSQVKPFHRCISCNDTIHPVNKKKILARIPTKTAIHFEKFYECSGCRKIYWEGSHYYRMKEQITGLLKEI